MEIYVILLSLLSLTIAAPITKNSTAVNNSADFSIKTEISINQYLSGSALAAFNNWKVGCVYGKNCGLKCDTLPPKIGAWNDDLDQACYQHDLCLRTRKVRYDQRGAAVCHYALARYSGALYSTYSKCSWWQFWCREAKKIEISKIFSTVFNGLGRYSG
jgi:hypothetical protein